MEIGIKEANEISTITVTGEIDLYNAPDLKGVLSKLISDRKKQIIINLNRVSYIDSSGIGVLISSVNSIKKVNGHIKLCSLTPGVKKVLELTKLITFFELFTSEQSALDSFSF